MKVAPKLRNAIIMLKSKRGMSSRLRGTSGLLQSTKDTCMLSFFSFHSCPYISTTSMTSTRFVASTLLLGLIASAHAAVNCTSSAIPRPAVFGAEILDITASANYSFMGIPGNDVCAVTVVLTHPGTGDRVNNYILLPLTGWNGVFQGIGGGGYTAGSLSSSANQTALGYSTGTTDAGLPTTPATATEVDASYWALLSPGNVNHQLLLNFAHRSYHDMNIIGKAISASFYDCPAKYSYWNGCSTGGRQGLIHAQYYPSDYDGILADAPAIQWTDFSMAQQWPYTVENIEGYAPPPCEFDAVVAAVIKACDGLDGLVDGLISAPALCNFTAQSLVGKQYICDTDGSTGTFSQKLATIVDKTWQGPRTPEGQWLWYGFTRGANFTGVASNLPNSTVPQPFLISDSWVRGFVAKNLTFNTANVSYAEFAGTLSTATRYDIG